VARLSDFGEHELIRRLTAALPGGPGIRVGPGDDAAVLVPEPGRDLVVTTDAFVRGRHWRDAWIAPAALGARLALANLSDLSAMAARPRWALVAMGLARERDAEWVGEVQRGLAETLAREEVTLVGGNLSGVSAEEWLSLTLIGDALPGRVWRRRGARPGDALAVTGRPGRAGAAIRAMEALDDGALAP